MRRIEIGDFLLIAEVHTGIDAFIEWVRERLD
jgi:hypothetical protein